ncbi:Spermatogenesis-associated protein 7-like protein [Frankliniella fusca]|uniref:Spermatogenesis-associated protein 7-like protein n=1 Tax=Frankliniella fusca TaxID=407009 RepID=A0AAE1HVK5_9NEOP|nr:Spermatogenesis-associated protein 7-like protein [Frankliniella fusca]KAK3918535.1 Spermatogenesis-associated protein 7-like protein [Frankliniella fusca]KAK3919810.1 Spermatogenesis-associated protein 7-like protein [Frankliniella fusca]KAK3927631.1 Spermatogenesis-associated protein 7-like protein [Frankliniella fusca]
MQSLLLEEEWLFNLVQCDVWKRKVARFSNEVIVIPINVYYDEVEPNAALGPHCEPLGCTYVQIAVLPPEWNSRLENIFLALLFNAHDRSLYGNYRAFKPLLQELKLLELEGIEIVTKEKGPVRVHIVVAWILGDNKGLNGICGFMEGFTAIHFCRICHVTKADSEQMFEEDVNLLRTHEDYLLDITKNDPKQTGIKEKCIFNKLPSFETPSDICVDEFHDLSEGVAHYSMVAILKHFHRLNDMFIPTLNSRLYALDLGIDNDNRPPGISTDRLLTKSKLKMTGAEMYMIVRIFGVLVYDMIPDGDPFYDLYLLLHDIMSIIRAKSLPRDAGVILSVAVKEHNQLYVHLTKETLKPKHHFLLHYKSLLSKMGPFSGVSSIRFEAKHRMLKLTAESCMSRVNLPKTVAIKQQLGFCFRCVANASIRQPLSAGPCQTVNLSELDCFPSFSRSLPCDIVESPIQTVVNWVNFKGTKYQPQQILLTDVDDDGLFQFGKIQLILLYDEKPLFICSDFDTLGYFSEVRGYEVTPLDSWFAIGHGKLLDYHPLCLYPMPTGETVVVLRTLL